MKLTRIIHSVGQGAFYTETIFNDKDNEYFNIVYDCGSETKSKNDKKTTIEYRIDCYLSLLREQQGIKSKDKPIIDAVFISHFHDDHINGLDYLLNNAKVQYLFIPQLTEVQIIEFVMYNIINNQEKNMTDLIFNILNKRLEKDTRIIKVKVLDKNSDENMGKRTKISSLNGDIFSGARLYSDIFKKWLYIPYNPKVLLDETKLNELHENLKKEFSVRDNFSYQELPEILKGKDKLEKCREIYGKAFGKNNHNSYSMTLFSGQEQLKKIEIIKSNKNFYGICCKLDLWKYIIKCYNNCIINIYPNCLYTGDFEVENNFNELKNFYNNFNLWETIQTIQVPHHCSRNNYLADLYLNIYSCFISVGIQNKYGHPNIDTLISIQQQVKDVNIVTEDINTMKIYKYCVK